MIRLISLGKGRASNVNTMKAEVLKKRLDKNRPMTTITIRIPEDVIEDLKRVAPLLGFSGYQPLVRAYIGQGLRADLERLEGDTVSTLIASLKRHGVSDEIICEAPAKRLGGSFQCCGRNQQLNKAIFWHTSRCRSEL